MKTMNFIRQNFLITIFLSIIQFPLWGIESIAHKDPAGDIFPVVFAEEEMFFVYYHSNVEDKYYKDIYDLEGKLKENRIEIASMPSEEYEGKLESMMLTDGDFISQKMIDEWFIIPKWSRIHKGQPFYYQTLGNGKIVKSDLDWKNFEIDIVPILSYFLRANFNRMINDE